MTEEEFKVFLDQSKNTIGRYLDMMQDVLRRTNIIADVLDALDADAKEDRGQINRWISDVRAAEEFATATSE